MTRIRSQALAPYAQIKQRLKDRLAEGRWPPGVQMPSEAELVAEFGVSRMTVNRALKELQAEGWVERVQGVGTFAVAPHKVSSVLKLRDIHEEIVGRGHVHTAQVDVLCAKQATPEVAAQLGLAKGALVFHSRIVHCENGLPLQVEDRHVNPKLVPDYLAQDFGHTTPTHYLFEVTHLWRAEYTIEAGLPSAREAQLLGIGPQEPCLIQQRRTFSREAPITLARLVYPGHRYSLSGQLDP